MSDRAGAEPGEARGPDGVSGLLVPTLLFGSYLMAAAAGGTLLLAGSRVFALSAGGSALSGLAVVAAVGLGAIIGGTIAGRKAGTTSAPGAILAALQAALGLAAILGVILFRAARAAYLVVWPILGGTALGAWGLRFGLALSLLTLAASCFFAMPPMLARLIVAGR